MFQSAKHYIFRSVLQFPTAKVQLIFEITAGAKFSHIAYFLKNNYICTHTRKIQMIQAIEWY